MPAPAGRQVGLPADTERVADVALGPAADAFELDVRAEVAAEVPHLQPRVRRLRAVGAAVDEQSVREVVEMTAGAGKQEPRRHGQRSGALGRAAVVGELRLIRPPGPVVGEGPYARVV